MALYDALEYLSCGPVGLFLLLLFFNALNVAFMWNEHYAVISLIVTPVALASNALNSVQRNAALRVRMERANAEHLRAPDGDPFEDYHVADEEASDEEAPGEDECPRDGPSVSVLIAVEDERLVGEIVPHPGMQVLFQTAVRCDPHLAMLRRTLPLLPLVPIVPRAALHNGRYRHRRLEEGQVLRRGNLGPSGRKARDGLALTCGDKTKGCHQDEDQFIFGS
ncbi:hypothetical protein F444_22587 [Phytophthora nicotianae P1976]|uniref:Uncharacterized protein n=1 Tax=Phytophthora nicotianae P1976 TaxID=1317066 RepID=A0A080YXC5_PHYNI|nr:hypothetical protein F444_22587 [Phytophthora nicotianae P1976]